MGKEVSEYKAADDFDKSIVTLRFTNEGWGLIYVLPTLEPEASTDLQKELQRQREKFGDQTNASVSEPFFTLHEEEPWALYYKVEPPISKEVLRSLGEKAMSFVIEVTQKPATLTCIFKQGVVVDTIHKNVPVSSQYL